MMKFSASAVSITRLTFILKPSLIKKWWTAETANKEGIGAFTLETFLSDKIIIFLPSETRD